MNQIGLITRAWSITWRFRVLWIFGILLALTGGGGGGGTGWRGSSGDLRNFGAVPTGGLPNWSSLIGLIVLCCCALLIVVVVATIVHYVVRAALYRMVDGIEATGTASSWQEGFRLGWTNRTFRLFLLDLLIFVPTFAVVLVLFGIAAVPAVLFHGAGGGLRALGIFMTVILGLLVLVLLIAAGIALSLLGQIWSREIALRDLSIGQALVSGYALVRGSLGSLGLLWLLMFGIGLIFFVVILPVTIGLLALGAVVGGGLGYGFYAATHSVLLAVLAGLPVFLVIVVVPLSIVRGIYLTWQYSTWTLAYREVTGRASAAPAVAAAQ